MGHLIRISNHILEETKKPPLDAIMVKVVEADTLTQWQEFVDTALAKVNGDQNSGMVSAFQGFTMEGSFHGERKKNNFINSGSQK